MTGPLFYVLGRWHKSCTCCWRPWCHRIGTYSRKWSVWGVRTITCAWNFRLSSGPEGLGSFFIYTFLLQWLRHGIEFSRVLMVMPYFPRCLESRELNGCFPRARPWQLLVRYMLLLIYFSTFSGDLLGEGESRFDGSIEKLWKRTELV